MYEKNRLMKKRTLAFLEGEKTAAEPTHYVTRLSQAPLLPEDPTVGKNRTHRVPTPAPHSTRGKACRKHLNEEVSS
jgi:hypothetical protein